MTKTHTTELEQLRLTEVAERQRARDNETAAETAKLTANQRREGLIEATASGAGIKAAEKARADALAEVETAGIQAEAAKRRADRAAKATQAYEAEHARALIAEIEPAANEAAERLQQAAADLLAADATWYAIRQRVGDLVSATPGASAANDLGDGHALTEIARRLRRASIEIEPPLPHWRGVEHHAGERERVEELRRERAA